MSETVKLCVGNSSKLLLALLIVGFGAFAPANALEALGASTYSRGFPITDLNCIDQQSQQAQCYGAHGVALQDANNPLVTATTTLKYMRIYLGASTFGGYNPATTEFRWQLYSNNVAQDCYSESGKTANSYVPTTASVSTVREVLAIFSGQQCFLNPGTTYSLLLTAGGNGGAVYIKGQTSSYAIVQVSDTILQAPESISVYDTRFNSQTITGTRSQLNIMTDYFLDLTELNSSNRPNSIRTDIVNAQGIVVLAYINTTSYKNTQGQHVSTSTVLKSSFYNGNDLPDGQYTALTKFYSTSLNGPVLLRSYVQVGFTVNGGNSFTSTTQLNSNGLLPEMDSNVEQACGITSLGGCIVNAFSYLFLPDISELSQVTNFTQNLQTKFPFAYIYDFQSTIQTLYSNPQNQVTSIGFNFAGLGQLTLISQQMVSNVPFAPLIKNTLGYMMWILFGFIMYKRSLKIFNTNPI